MFDIIFKIGLIIAAILAFIGVILKSLFNNVFFLSYINKQNSQLKKVTLYAARKSTLFISLSIIVLIILLLTGIFSGQ